MVKEKRKLTNFGKEVKKRLIDMDMTLAELAGEIGIDSRYIDHIIHGRKSGKKYIGRIMEILGIEESA